MNHQPWQAKVNALKDALSQRPGIRVIPKHTVLSLLGPRCCDCHEQVILATGALKLGRCGRCSTKYYDVPPAA